jgi:hypothetical protein
VSYVLKGAGVTLVFPESFPPPTARFQINIERDKLKELPLGEEKADTPERLEAWIEGMLRTHMPYMGWLENRRPFTIEWNNRNRVYNISWDERRG